MSIASLIIAIISGAVVGYFTNWLAIRMLFRPHTEKRLFGRRLPFTPGLIPKEKHVLSKKIGESLAKNILTEDELTRAVASPEVMNKLEFLLDGLLSDLSNGVYSEQTEKICGFAADKLTDLILSRDEVLQGIAKSLYEKIKDYTLTAGKEYLKGEAFREKLTLFAEELLEKLDENSAKISDYIPESLVTQIRTQIIEKAPEITAFIKALPERYPDIDEKLSALVTKIAQDHLGVLLGVFIRYEDLYGKIKNSFFNYLNETENQQYLAEKCVAIIDTVLDKRLNNLAAKIPQNMRGGATGAVTSLLRRMLSGGAADKLFAAVESRIQGYDLTGLLDRFNFTATVKKTLLSLAGVLTGSINGENAVKIRGTIIRTLQQIVEKGGAYVISSMQFDKIVENKINEFSVAETENLIISVVDRELKVITWLGGLLGMLIGIFTAIIQSLSL